MSKQLIGSLLRKIGLYKTFDFLRYLFLKSIKYFKNKKFKKKNPLVLLPHDYLMYESFQLDYTKYFKHSLESAKELINQIRKHKETNNLKILDWGCGPARIIRHLPTILRNQNCEIYGTDYNPTTIEWCKKNLQGIEFKHNNINPPLDFSDKFFDIIYGISIFTHLSEKMHYEWISELSRITKHGGIIYLTLHGNSFRKKLLKKELIQYDKGKLVVRDCVTEGHRTFATFHPKEFTDELFKDFEILEYIEGGKTGRPQQDIWILKKH